MRPFLEAFWNVPARDSKGPFVEIRAKLGRVARAVLRNFARAASCRGDALRFLLTPASLSAMRILPKRHACRDASVAMLPPEEWTWRLADWCDEH